MFFHNKPSVESTEGGLGLQLLCLVSSVRICQGLHILVMLRVHIARVFPGCQVLVIPDRVLGDGLGARSLVDVSIDLVDSLNQFSLDACECSQDAGKLQIGRWGGDRWICDGEGGGVGCLFLWGWGLGPAGNGIGVSNVSVNNIRGDGWKGGQGMVWMNGKLEWWG